MRVVVIATGVGWLVLTGKKLFALFGACVSMLVSIGVFIGWLVWGRRKRA